MERWQAIVKMTKVSMSKIKFENKRDPRSQMD